MEAYRIDRFGGPKISESVWRQFGVARGVLDIPVAQIMLDRPCVLAVGELLDRITLEI